MAPKEQEKSKAAEAQRDQNSGNTLPLKKANSLDTEKEDVQKSSTSKSGKNGG